MNIKYELQDIISGNGAVRNGEIIQAINCYLIRQKETVQKTEGGKYLKKEEEESLLIFIEKNHFWYNQLLPDKYIGEGAEQKIFEHSDPDFVIKLNNSIFYASWHDYIHSLLIHNYFFPHLSYELIGFIIFDNELNAVVKQPYVKSTSPTDLSNVKEFLIANGFTNKKNNDYYHSELGIILEDLHDENVLTEDGALQFIDTVFYLTPDFYKS